MGICLGWVDGGDKGCGSRYRLWYLVFVANCFFSFVVVIVFRLLFFFFVSFLEGGVDVDRSARCSLAEGQS